MDINELETIIARYVYQDLEMYGYIDDRVLYQYVRSIVVDGDSMIYFTRNTVSLDDLLIYINYQTDGGILGFVNNIILKIKAIINVNNYKYNINQKNYSR